MQPADARRPFLSAIACGSGTTAGCRVEWSPSSLPGVAIMPIKIEKLEAHASHLLDIFIGLREKFAMLEPMLFDETVVRANGSGARQRGFLILRHSLFLSCAQDIAKLCYDRDERTPRIYKLIESLGDTHLRKALDDRYAAFVSPSIEDETDPEIVEALRVWERKEQAELRAQFLALHQELVDAWATLSVAASTKAFHTIRDKVSAHTEVRHGVDKYQLIDIGALGIKWRDVGSTIQSMQRLVEIIGMVIRGASFAWDALDHSLNKAAVGFWNAPESKAP